MYSTVIENYIKTIYHLHLQHERVSTTELSQALKVKSASVTDMLQRLEEMELIDYKKYQGAILTEKGHQKAIELVRKHRLWEVFLVEKLQFNWSEVHAVAEQLEHIQSVKLIDNLEAFLGYPKWDPHGDPIPDKEGKFAPREQIPLFDLGIGETGTILGVTVDDEQFLRFLEQTQLIIGKTITIKNFHQFDESIQIVMEKTTINLSKKVATSILVRRIAL